MTVPMHSEEPVPVKVEARHIELADELLNAHVDASHSMRSAAQLIADSEAQATAELRAELERTRLALKDSCEVIVTIQAKLAASAPPQAQEQKP